MKTLVSKYWTVKEVAYHVEYKQVVCNMSSVNQLVEKYQRKKIQQ
jgi:hypothetical protein